MKKFEIVVEMTSRDYLYEVEANVDEVVNIIDKGNYIVTACNGKIVKGPYASSKATREINKEGKLIKTYTA
jgi:hypothetical protein